MTGAPLPVDPAGDVSFLAGEPLLAGLSSRYLRAHGIVPVRLPDGPLVLATTRPENADAIALVCATLGAEADALPRLPATAEEIAALLPEDDAAAAPPADAPSETARAGGRGEEDVERLLDLARNAPIVNLLNDLIEMACQAKATDIHCEPEQGECRVRVRVDGLLRVLRVLPLQQARPLVSRIKILAGLDIAERRLPQDGRMTHQAGNQELDIRVATMPTVWGEAAILRLLDHRRRLVGLDGLGLAGDQVTTLARHLAAPHGLVIVTGPTGSGKTTTLAAGLGALDRATRKVLTVEDPVEYEIAGVAQTQVRPQIGLTFATALRAFLRQDPDVIMVGEMRDGETARIGIQASLTGHLVLTTLHTNTAAAAIPRLVDLGVESYLVAASLRCVVGQRLVRVLCPHCKVRQPLTARGIAEDPRLLALDLRAGDEIHHPAGCVRCAGSGYAGRLGVFEMLEVTEALRALILAGASDREIEAAARQNGMSTMLEDGIAKIRAGITSVDEVLRVTAVM